VAAGNSPTYDYFATKDGHVVGKDAVFTASSLTNGDKFFEFALLRNETLAPNSASHPDSAAGYLAFNISIRWPAYMLSSSGAAVKVPDAQKSVMIVPAAITR
jgi:hypothetical protein